MRWSDLLTGIIAGVVATVLWTLLVWDQRRRRLKGQLAPLAGTYRNTRKLKDQAEPETVSITVRGEILNVRFAGLPDGDSVVGEIAMNEHPSWTGKGRYLHSKGQEQLWGFWDVQVKDVNTILVDTTYTSHKAPVAVVSGFIWSRIDAHAS